jgi:rod shape-determining protein MreC
MASEVVLITDPDFAAGAISQKNQARGVVKGQGTPLCKVDYVSFADKVEPGEWLYTSGDDRIFPRGLPVGVIKSARDGQPYKEVYMEPSGLRGGSLQDVLIVIDNVHQAIPDEPPGTQPVFIAPPPVAANPGEPAVAGGARPPAPASGAGTAADEVRTMYKASGDAQGHTFGAGAPGSKPPDFTKLGQPPAAAPAPVQKQGPAAGTVPKPPPTQAPGAAPAPVQKQAPASGTVPKSPLTQAPAPGAGGQAAPVQKKGPEPGTVPKPPPVQSPNGQTGVPPPR